MRTHRYLNVVLTIIALELGWIALTHTGVPVSAQQAGTRVILAGVEMPQNQLLPVIIRRAELEPGDFVPIEAFRPIKIEADRPIPIEAPRPLTVHIPVTTSPVPGL